MGANNRTGRGVLLAVLLAGAPCMRAQSVAAMPALERKSITGTWFEIARLPNKREKHCAADTIELIALGDKPATQLQLVDGCTDIKGYKDQWNFTATSKKKDVSGALKIGYIPFFTRKYWIIATGPIVPVEALPATKKDAPVLVTANPASDSVSSKEPDASATPVPKAADVNGAAVSVVAPPPPPPPTGYAWTLIGTPNHKQLWIFSRTAAMPADQKEQAKAKAAAMGFNVTKLVSTPTAQVTNGQAK